MNYFIHDERDLSPAYVKHCEKFLKEISYKPQAPSGKPQAPSNRRHDPDTIKWYKILWEEKESYIY